MRCKARQSVGEVRKLSPDLGAGGGEYGGQVAAARGRGSGGGAAVQRVLGVRPDDAVDLQTTALRGSARCYV